MAEKRTDRNGIETIVAARRELKAGNVVTLRNGDKVTVLESHEYGGDVVITKWCPAAPAGWSNASRGRQSSGYGRGGVTGYTKRTYGFNGQVYDFD